MTPHLICRSLRTLDAHDVRMMCAWFLALLQGHCHWRVHAMGIRVFCLFEMRLR